MSYLYLSLQATSFHIRSSHSWVLVMLKCSEILKKQQFPFSLALRPTLSHPCTLSCSSLAPVNSPVHSLFLHQNLPSSKRQPPTLLRLRECPHEHSWHCLTPAVTHTSVPEQPLTCPLPLQHCESQFASPLALTHQHLAQLWYISGKR